MAILQLPKLTVGLVHQFWGLNTDRILQPLFRKIILSQKVDTLPRYGETRGQSYRAEAGLTQPVHPHLFRHQMITYLTSRGLSDAQIQLISGHESKKSLEIYQHISLDAVEQAYQEAVQSVTI